MKAKISILAIYNQTNGMVFDRINLPSGIIKQDVIDTILMNCAELSLVYPNPDILEQMIRTWSTNKKPAWERIYKALAAQYDPLYNYDRHEEWTDTGTTKRQTSGTASATGSNTESVAGFNQGAGLADSRKNDQTTGSSSSGTDNEDRIGGHSGHIYGNIGVTTSAQMLQGEITVRLQNDMNQIICDSFKNQFCIQIY